MTAASKNTKRAVMRAYGVPDSVQTTHLRYKTPIEKGILWYWLSQYVRKRDYQQYGTCISCGRKVESRKELSAGHFINASVCGRDLLFDPMNVHGECAGCNKYDKQKLNYERNLDKRYGKGTAQRLKERYYAYRDGPPVREFRVSEYRDKISHVKSLFTEI